MWIKREKMFGLGENFIVYLNTTINMYFTDFATDIKLFPLLYKLSSDNFTMYSWQQELLT